MSRLEPIPPHAMDADQRRLYESITTGPRAQGPQHFALTRDDGALLGPFNAFLLSPSLGGALQELGAAIRYQTTLTARAREIAILTVAALWHCAFELSAHEKVGRAVGLTDTELADLRVGVVPDLADPYERACANLTWAMARGDVDESEWRTWAAVVGEVAVFELTTLVGYYATLALQLRILRID